MADDSNLALDIQELPGTGDSPGSLTARVYLSIACSYLKDVGAPTITEDCNTFAEFEREVSRIKSECDEILARAQSLFDDTKSNPAAGAERGQSQPRQAGLPEAATDGDDGKKPAVKIAKHLRVADAMTRDTKTMRRNDKLSVGDDLMKVGKFRHMVVLEDDGKNVAGIISHRDIFYGALAWSTGMGESAHQKSLDTIPAKDVMNTNVITTSPDAPLADACGVMIEKKIGCLPVIEDRTLVGILTEGDLLAILSRAEYDAV
jgi:CBS domain-containing membrane protein